ncbi:unnamed protein product [Symbiodinium sp. KB8]|nr:unnamed protein product [Symbiodinium sp. KB8]
MPGPWIGVVSDPEGRKDASLGDSDCLEFAAYEGDLCRKGTVVMTSGNSRDFHTAIYMMLTVGDLAAEERDEKTKKRRREAEESAQGERTEINSSSATSESTSSKEKKKKKEKSRARGAQMILQMTASFFQKAHSGGTSLQPQVQEYVIKRQGRLASRLLQKMQVMVAKEGTPALTLDKIAAGHYQYAADKEIRSQTTREERGGIQKEAEPAMAEEDPLATMLSSEFLDFEFDLGHSDDEGLPHQAIVICLDFLYSGWSQPVCVPMSPVLGANQKKALAKEAVAKLASKRFDYSWQLGPESAQLQLLPNFPSDIEVLELERAAMITNGAGGVSKVKMGQTDRGHIAIYWPAASNPGREGLVPGPGLGDLQSAFNLFSLPLSWAGAMLSKTPFSDLDLAFYPIEAAIRHIAYLIAKIPSRGDVSMGSAIPDTESKTVLCADNFDEIRHLKEIAAEEAGTPSPNHLKFIGTCKGRGGSCAEHSQEPSKEERCWGKPGCFGTLVYEKTIALISLGLGMLTQATLPEYSLRHCAGKAALAAAFVRDPSRILRALDTRVVEGWSAPDATPPGGGRGGSSEAGVFKQKTLLPDAVEDVNLCGACETEMQEAARRSAGKCHREEGLVEAKKRGPYASYLVDLDLSTENAGTGVFAPCLCWFGGPKEQWLGFLHNSESLHAVLNKPVCDCGAQHQREDPADLEQEDDEYPPAWSWQKEPMTS